jgi:hypothetical protein
LKVKLIYTPVTGQFIKIDPTIVMFPSGYYQIHHLAKEELVDDFIKLFKGRKRIPHTIAREFNSFKSLKEYNYEN